MEKCGYRSVIACSARRYFCSINLNLTTPTNDLRDGAMIGGDDLTQIFGIETRREFGRADEVAEHHGELPALCIDGRR